MLLEQAASVRLAQREAAIEHPVETHENSILLSIGRVEDDQMMFKSFVVAAILPVSAAAMAGDLPVVNSEKYCSAMFPLSTASDEPLDFLRLKCLMIEEKFRGKALRIWSDIPQSIRDQCFSAQILSPAGVSYEGIAHCLARHVAHAYFDDIAAEQ
jgi:hypothetical protein